MEAEYIALSKPLRIVLDEVSSALGLKHDPHSFIRSTIFEDNQACLLLASSDPPKITHCRQISLVPRTTLPWENRHQAHCIVGTTRRHFYQAATADAISVLAQTPARLVRHPFLFLVFFVYYFCYGKNRGSVKV